MNEWGDLEKELKQEQDSKKVIALEPCMESFLQLSHQQYKKYEENH